jgi:hypothetical protein
MGLSNPPKNKEILGAFLVMVVKEFMELFELNGSDAEGQEGKEEHTYS